MFELARDSAVKARSQALTRSRGVLVTATLVLREWLFSLGDPELFRARARQPAPVASLNFSIYLYSMEVTLVRLLLCQRLRSAARRARVGLG